MRERTFIILIIGLIAIFLILGLLSFARGGLSVSNSLKLPYYRLLYQITGAENNPQKLKKLHQTMVVKEGVERADSAPCLACHGSMVEPGQEDHRKAKKPIHQAMLTAPMLGFECTDCHPKVDIRPRTPTHVTIKVNRKLCAQFPCHSPAIMAEHGEGDPVRAKKWLLNHPRLAKTVGFEECRKCHFARGELDICQKCHTRGGFRPSSHRAYYNLPVSRIFPEIRRSDVVTTRWKGFHFVFAREALEKMGVSGVSAANLPLDKVEELPCRFCHVLKKWCTRCHIKHAPNWLDPVAGHPARVKKSGSNYCFRCHDELGSKCLSCHTYVGQIK